MILHNLLHEGKLIKISNFSSALTLFKNTKSSKFILLSLRPFHSLLDFLAIEFHLLLTMPVISTLFVASYLFCRASLHYETSRIIFTITLPPLLTICQFLYFLDLITNKLLPSWWQCFITIESNYASCLINDILNRKHV